MLSFNIIIISIYFISRIRLIINDSVLLSVQNNDYFKGADHYGVNMGHAASNSNWLQFLNRLGVNAARLFVSPVYDLRKFIGSKKWGQNLNGDQVTNKDEFINSINELRSSLDFNEKWQYSVKWKEILKGIEKVTNEIQGSDEHNINTLNKLNITTLLVFHIGCGKSSISFEFKSMNSLTSEYWSERWELYKMSYALAVWARLKQAQLIEFYNEPDLKLDECLDAQKFKDYYLIRSLSIHDAYEDLNRNNSNKTRVNVKLAASAFARKTYGRNTKRYLGDVCVQNNNLKFTTNKSDLNWSNMEVYSYHSYGKSGDDMLQDALYLRKSIDSDSLYSNQFPLLISEFNTHTASDWDKLNTTGDDDFEASRLASQLINLISSRQVSSLFVFKFSIMPSFSNTRAIAKNGLHYGDFEKAPYHLSDSLLVAESVRLLSSLKQTLIYSLESNDTSKYRTYLSTKQNGYYYILAVNDKNSPVELVINTSSWNINASLVFIESVNKHYWGEISHIIAYNKLIAFSLDSFTSVKFTFETSRHNLVRINSNLVCYALAGANSEMSNCNTSEIKISTSPNLVHDTTSVGLIKFDLSEKLGEHFKAILNINVKKACQTTLVVLGVKYLNRTKFAWNDLDNVLNRLPNGTLIDKISKNFINWSPDLVILGHFNLRNSNEKRMLDLTDFVKSLTKNLMNELSVLIYRPYRHAAYKTTSGVLPNDDLANGCVTSLYGYSDSSLRPVLNIFNKSD